MATHPRFGAGYDLWRLEKANATPEDRSRTRRDLGNLIEGLNNEAGRAYLCESLTTTLRYDTIPVETGERILAVLLERRVKVCGNESQLAQLLVVALRTENPDIRLRIQNAVLFLATQHGGAVEQALENWKPAKSDSAADIEDRVRKWGFFWSSAPVPAATAPDAAPAKK